MAFLLLLLSLFILLLLSPLFESAGMMEMTITIQARPQRGSHKRTHSPHGR